MVEATVHEAGVWARKNGGPISVIDKLPDIRVRPSWQPEKPKALAGLSYKRLMLQEIHGEELADIVRIYGELLLYHDERNDHATLENRLRWHFTIACGPDARLWGIYDGARLVGILLAQVQEMYYVKRLWVHGYYLRKGYLLGAVGRQLEQEMYDWGKSCGASTAEFETNRQPSAWNRRSGYRLHGFLMRKALR